ncbi:MAG: aminoacyl-tRNA hydrolase [Candidatus Obscuribacterales bacterium]|nr:aminoacyl-tRNA hydrolase [Candidatus Obscuribacterales bacterium]
MNILEFKPAKVVAGLGNFGQQYEYTRHNAGFFAIEKVALSLDTQFFACELLQAELAAVHIDAVPVLLVKPNSGIAGMNSSGIPVKAVINHYNINPTPDNLIVAYDEIEMSGTRVNLVYKKSRLHHNGVASVSECLDNARFARLRIPVGPPPANRDFKTFALTEIEGNDLDIMMQACNSAATAIKLWVSEGVERAANKTNNQ